MFDIKSAEAKKIIDININGWVPLKIEYGYYQISQQRYLLWNIVGVNHTFNVPIKIVVQHHGGDYIDHFILTLDMLSKDLLDSNNEFNHLDYRQELYSLLESTG